VKLSEAAIWLLSKSKTNQKENTTKLEDYSRVYRIMLYGAKKAVDQQGLFDARYAKCRCFPFPVLTATGFCIIM
jgi:hypothetical protein